MSCYADAGAMRRNHSNQSNQSNLSVSSDDAEWELLDLVRERAAAAAPSLQCGQCGWPADRSHRECSAYSLRPMWEETSIL
jgi:hypothetical protein